MKDLSRISNLSEISCFVYVQSIKLSGMNKDYWNLLVDKSERLKNNSIVTSNRWLRWYHVEKEGS